MDSLEITRNIVYNVSIQGSPGVFTEAGLAYDGHPYVAADQTVYLPLSVWGLDHGAGLHVSQLLDAALALDNVTHLQRQVGVLVHLTHLETRQMGESQLDLIVVQEILGPQCTPLSGLYPAAGGSSSSGRVSG